MFSVIWVSRLLCSRGCREPCMEFEENLVSLEKKPSHNRPSKETKGVCILERPFSRATTRFRVVSNFTVFPKLFVCSIILYTVFPGHQRLVMIPRSAAVKFSGPATGPKIPRSLRCLLSKFSKVNSLAPSEFPKVNPASHGLAYRDGRPR